MICTLPVDVEPVNSCVHQLEKEKELSDCFLNVHSVTDVESCCIMLAVCHITETKDSIRGN